jgi:sulfate transport system permease protein
MTTTRWRRSVLPGFPLAMGVTMGYLSLIVLLPLCALLLQAMDIGWTRFFAILSSPRTVAAFKVTFLAAAGATLFNAVYGLALAWVLARYQFPGKRILDALVDVPFALPTAVAGLALATLFSQNGWFGAPLAQLGVTVIFTPLGIAVAMAFTALPFVVRQVQPVLEDVSAEVEEAALTLGASDWKIFRAIIFPAIFPAFLAGCSLGFARSIGEFGAIIFIAGNKPNYSEIAALLTFIRLEEYDYPAAATISTALLLCAFLLLTFTNLLQAWHLRYIGRED